jgi:hypothetical protein
MQHKEAFLTAVIAERRCRRWACLAAAVPIAAYINHKTQDAWPSIERLAQDLGADRRTVQRALRDLVAADLLVRRQGGGRKRSSHYELKGGQLAAVSDEKGGAAGPKRAAVEPPKRKKNEPLNTRRSVAPYSARVDHPQSDKPTCFPPQWTFGSDEAATALHSSARWPELRASREFEKFQHWHTERRTRSTNWAASWGRWCAKGHDIAVRDAARTQGKDKAGAAAAGAAGWYERQKAYASGARQPEGTTNDPDDK